MSRELTEIRFPSPQEIFSEVLEASTLSEEERAEKLEDFGAAMVFDKLDFYESMERSETGKLEELEELADSGLGSST